MHSVDTSFFCFKNTFLIYNRQKKEEVLIAEKLLCTDTTVISEEEVCLPFCSC